MLRDVAAAIDTRERKLERLHNRVLDLRVCGPRLEIIAYTVVG